MTEYHHRVTEDTSIALGPDEHVPERPFTDVGWNQHDLLILHGMAAEVRELLTDETRTLLPYHGVVWQADGLTHRHVVCSVERLRTHPRPCVVGFFGDRRKEVEATPLDEANTAIIGEFLKYPGILCYSSVELRGGNWANLVLHDDPVDTEYWRQSALHAQAVKSLARIHYTSVRIHNGQLTARVLDDPAIVLHRTKYYDYTDPTGWRAVRTLN
jgi:hypothetical protein